jgi:hypothetical protein
MCVSQGLQRNGKKTKESDIDILAKQRKGKNIEI